MIMGFFAPMYEVSDISLAIVNNDSGNLSPSILANIPEILSKEYFDSLEAAKDSIKNHKNKAIYLIPENFSLNILSNSKFSKSPELLMTSADNQQILPSIASAITQAFNKTAFEQHLTQPTFKDKVGIINNDSRIINESLIILIIRLLII